MVINFNRRDIGYTIISRLELIFREFIIARIGSASDKLSDIIPVGIINKAYERSGRTSEDDISEILDESDFVDLLDICFYRQNFKLIFPDKQLSTDKDWLSKTMGDLYALRCKIAHVKGYFTSIDLDKLIDLSRDLAYIIDQNKDLVTLLYNIEREPTEFVIKTPLSFNSESIGQSKILNNLPTPDYELDGGFVGRENDIKNIISLIGII